MAEIKFYANTLAGQQEAINHTVGSGIGFYGSSHGVSVPIGSQQDTTFVTDAGGTAQGTALQNTKYSNNNDNRGLSPGQVLPKVHGSVITLDKLPNDYCPLNIRFTHNTAVKTQNCKLRIFDRNSIDTHAVDVVTYAYEARHPSSEVNSEGQLAHRAPGVSNSKWFIFEKDYRNDGAIFGADEQVPIEDMPFTNSPGISGLNTIDTDNTLAGIPGATKQGSSHRSTRHDWFVALSSEPVTIGSKTSYGLYFSVEYL